MLNNHQQITDLTYNYRYFLLNLNWSANSNTVHRPKWKQKTALMSKDFKSHLKKVFWPQK